MQWLELVGLGRAFIIRIDLEFDFLYIDLSTSVSLNFGHVSPSMQNFRYILDFGSRLNAIYNGIVWDHFYDYYSSYQVLLH